MRGLVCVLVWSTFVAGCSKVGFGTQSSSSTSSSNGSLSTGNPQVIDTSNPVASIIAQPCTLDTNCLVEFVLSAPVQYDFSFDWKTNDSAYGTPAPAGDPPYGEAGVDYVSTSGRADFPAGTTTVKVYVKNINPGINAISIGIEMESCSYNELLSNCSDYFR